MTFSLSSANLACVRAFVCQPLINTLILLFSKILYRTGIFSFDTWRRDTQMCCFRLLFSDKALSFALDRICFQITILVMAKVAPFISVGLLVLVFLI